MEYRKQVGETLPRGRGALTPEGSHHECPSCFFAGRRPLLGGLCALARDFHTVDYGSSGYFLAKAQRTQRGSMNASERTRRSSHGFHGFTRMLMSGRGLSLPYCCNRGKPDLFRIFRQKPIKPFASAPRACALCPLRGEGL